ncbi:MAG: 30S ribosomal protein S24e [Candidatus Micrarchaeota archaeon]|nr:30S ribosomal protein S24e [Candidatus Micrarchaeota archaeon]
MEVSVISEKKNPVMKRRELVLSVDYNGGPTPSKEELKNKISAVLSVEPERVEVSKVLSEKGAARGRVWIKIKEVSDENA